MTCVRSSPIRTGPGFTQFDADRTEVSATRWFRNPTARRRRSARSALSTPWAPSSRMAYFTPRSHSGSACLTGSAGTSARSTARSSLIDRSSRRTLTSSTTSDGLSEFAVTAQQPRPLVSVDLAGDSGPANPRPGIVVEEHPAVQRDPTSQLQRGAVEHHEIGSRREQHVEGGRRIRRPPGRNVEIRVSPRRTARWTSGVAHQALAGDAPQLR